MSHPERAFKCMRSGWCCKKAPCGFGMWTEDESQCTYLEGEKAGEYSCGKYDEIVAGAPKNAAHISPAFGGGCCATLNDDRIRMGYQPFLTAQTSEGNGSRGDS